MPNKTTAVLRPIILVLLPLAQGRWRARGGSMKRLLAGLVLLTAPVIAKAGEFRVGLTAGGSLLTRRDGSFSHGGLSDEVTVGASLLIGIAAEMDFDGRNRLALELVAGPYHNDVERSCLLIVFPDVRPCTLQPERSVSRALLWGMQYTHGFGAARWRPYLGGGFGVRTHWVKYAWFEDPLPERQSMATLGVSLGLERASRSPGRVEARALTVLQNPFFPSSPKTHVELQLRAAFLLPVH